MIFDHKDRFEVPHRAGQDETGKGPQYLPQLSSLSSKGTKIVDSYVQRPPEDRYESNMILKNDMICYAQSNFSFEYFTRDDYVLPDDSPNDMYKYKPNKDIVQPRTICPKWSETPRFSSPPKSEAIHLGPYSVKGDFDKIPPSYQSPVKYFGSSDRHLRFYNEDVRSHHSISAQNSVFEEPSFSDFTYCNDEEDDVSHLSLESYDRFFKATTERSATFKLGEKVKYPEPDNIHVPGPGQYDVKLPRSRHVGIQLKSRLNYPPCFPQSDAPGPNKYNTTRSSIVCKSFNAQAIANMRAASNILDSRPRPPISSRPSDNTAGGRGGRRTSNTAPSYLNSKARERFLIDASSFLAEKAGDRSEAPTTEIEAVRASPRPDSTSVVTVVRTRGGHVKKKRAPTVVDDHPVRVSKAEVRSARNLFGNILKSTETIIGNSRHDATIEGGREEG